MSDLCNDNRFELIEKYKKELIEATNIETSSDEMAVLDNILFRFWQMGWLDKLDASSAQSEIIHCKDCKYSNDKSIGYTRCIRPTFSFWMPEDGFCSYGKRREDE